MLWEVKSPIRGATGLPYLFGTFRFRAGGHGGPILTKHPLVGVSSPICTFAALSPLFSLERSDLLYVVGERSGLY